MSIVESIDNQLKNMNNDYEVKDIDFIPQITNMSTKKAYKIKVCALYVELRGANLLDINKWEESISLIHKLAIDPIFSIISENDGTIVDTPNNGILAIWPASKSNNNKAVEVAMTIKWVLDVKFDRKQIAPHFDYGIGIHQGDTLAIKTQIPGGNFDDEQVRYISPIINIVQTMSGQLTSPDCIGISENVYASLYEDTLKIKKSFVLIPYEKNIWDDNKINFNAQQFKIKTTEHHMDLNDKSITKK